MPELRFNDGSVIETGGELRRLELEDGLYVTGEGFLIPVKTEEDVTRVIKELSRVSEHKKKKNESTGD